MEKFSKKILELKKVQFRNFKQVLKDPKVIFYLNIFPEQNVMCPIDEAASDIAFICKKYYAKVLLKELGLLNTTLNTYQHVNYTLHNVLRQQKILLILFTD